MSPRLRFTVLSRDRFTCRYCGRKAPHVVLEVDHVKPRAAGGEDTLVNLVTSCLECNRGKHDAMIPEAPEKVLGNRSEWIWYEEPFLREEWEEEFSQESSPFWRASDIRWWLMIVGPLVKHEVRFAAGSGRGWKVGSQPAFHLLTARCDDIAADFLSTKRLYSEIHNDETIRYFYGGGKYTFDINRLMQRQPKRGRSVSVEEAAALRKRGWVTW